MSRVEAAAEYVAEVERLRNALKGIVRAHDLSQARALALNALNYEPWPMPAVPLEAVPPDTWGR